MPQFPHVKTRTLTERTPQDFVRITSTKTSQVANTWYSIDKRQLLGRCHDTGQKTQGVGEALYETAGESGGGSAWTKLAAVEMTRNQCHHSGHKEQSREKTVKVTTGGLKLEVPVTAAPMWGAWGVWREDDVWEGVGNATGTELRAPVCKASELAFYPGGIKE